MKGLTILFFMVFLLGNTSAQSDSANYSDSKNYQLDVRLRLDLIFGECPLVVNEGGDELDGEFLSDLATCTSNFFNPAIPSPLSIFDPITGEQYEKKIEYLKGELGFFSIIESPFRAINMIIYTVLEMIASVINFLIAFAGRFFFTYMFYVLILFNTILGLIDQQRQLEHEDRVYATGFIIVFATIFTLAGGLM